MASLSTSDAIELLGKIEETFIDKSEWGEGLWQHEPDRVEWTDAASSYLCSMRRHDNLGHWCGYVDIPKHHPAYGAQDDHDCIAGLDCHGGVTLTAAIGESWRIGFDCGHYMDLQPKVKVLAYIPTIGK